MRARTESRVDAPARPSEKELRGAVAAAVRAPSVHNTQPWQFRTGVRHVEVYADRSRRLPVLDPHGRELVVSCGAAVGCLRLALAAAGWRTSVLPTPSDDRDHLAQVRVLEPQPPSGDDEVMAGAVLDRRSVRTALTRRRLHTTQVEALTAEAVRCGVTATVLEDGLREDVLVLQARADALLDADPAYREEVARWTRPRDTATDGITALPVDRAPVRRPSEWAQRSFPASRSAFGAPPAAPGVADDPLVLVLSAPDDVPGWLATGEALARVLVRAHSLGFAGVPMTQVVEVASERERLRQLLRRSGQPQSLLRLGHQVVPQVARPSLRRPLDEVLRAPQGWGVPSQPAHVRW